MACNILYIFIGTSTLEELALPHLMSLFCPYQRLNGHFQDSHWAFSAISEVLRIDLCHTTLVSKTLFVFPTLHNKDTEVGFRGVVESLPYTISKSLLTTKSVQKDHPDSCPATHKVHCFLQNTRSLTPT
jgi:hypothetical protein